MPGTERDIAFSQLAVKGLKEKRNVKQDYKYDRTEGGKIN
jgi:hypothetical protein